MRHATNDNFSVLPEIIQSNQFAIEGASGFNLNQWKIVLWMMAATLPKDEESFMPTRITYKALKQFFRNGTCSRYEGDFSEYAYKLFRGMSGQVYSLRTEEGAFGFYPWFSGIEGTDFYQDGFVDFRFNEMLIPHLLNLTKNFTTSQLSSYMSFSSVYSIRLYNILSSVVWKKKETFEFDYFRHCMGLLNEERKINKYPAPAVCTRDVVTPAVAEINDKSNLSVKFKVVHSKENPRRVFGYEFVVEKKEGFVPSRYAPNLSMCEKTVKSIIDGRRTRMRIMDLEPSPLPGEKTPVLP